MMLVRSLLLLITMLAVLSLSCAQDVTKPPAASTTVQTNAAPPAPSPALEKTKRPLGKPIPMPTIQTIGEGKVWRSSEQKDQHGIYLPPWKKVEIANVFGFKKEPAVGSEVTVIPVGVDIAPFNLKIIETKRGAVCAQGEPPWWEVELEPVTRKEFFEIGALPGRSEEYPFDVGVIYPAVGSVYAVPKEQLKKEMLPPDIFVNTLTSAIDLTNDGTPDALVAEFCCREPSKQFPDCDYTCGKTYLKVKGTWKLVNESSPC